MVTLILVFTAIRTLIDRVSCMSNDIYMIPTWSLRWVSYHLLKYLFWYMIFPIATQHYAAPIRVIHRQQIFFHFVFFIISHTLYSSHSLSRAPTYAKTHLPVMFPFERHKHLLANLIPFGFWIKFRFAFEILNSYYLTSYVLIVDTYWRRHVRNFIKRI